MRTAPWRVGTVICPGLAIGLVMDCTSDDEYCRHRISGKTAWQTRAGNAGPTAICGSMNGTEHLPGRDPHRELTIWLVDYMPTRAVCQLSG